ncbi:MAG: ComEC/Rec2 family competence protein [Acidobacteria bacterium]|nr:ComEC/Rec2 family competence protein [Acidobacteriota bacterium]MCB9397969.1 ComEC/Rec2 family competence protein [Acidobacteriota bacterium]
MPLTFVAGGLWAASDGALFGCWPIGLGAWFLAWCLRKQGFWPLIALCFSAFCGSALWTRHGLERPDRNLSENEGPILLEGQVQGREPGQYGPRVHLRNLILKSPDSYPALPPTLTVYLPNQSALPRVGSRFRAWVKLHRSSAPRPVWLPFQEHYQRWRPHVYGTVKDVRLIQVQSESKQLSQLSEANRQLLEVFWHGQASSIWRDRLNPFGLGHLLAISGLHCGLFYGLMQLILFGIRRPWVRMLLTASGLLLFAEWMGWSASVTRACLMLGAWQFLPFLNRSRQWIRLWWGFLFLFLVLDPIHYLSRGVWLSFVASLGVMLGHRPLEKSPLIHPLRYRLRWIPPILGAQCLVIPISWAFGCFASPGGFAWNLMGLGFLAVLLIQWVLVVLSLFFAPLQSLANWSDFWLAEALNTLAQTPQWGWVAQSVSPLCLLLVITAMALALWMGPREKRWFLAVLPLLLWAVFWGPKRGPGLYLLDVGQGQACLLVDPSGGAWLIDGGGKCPSGLDLARIVQLWGGQKLKGIFISHCNADHYNLIESIPKNVPIYVPHNQYARFHTNPLFESRLLVPVQQGWRTQVEGGQLEVMWPPAEADESPSLNETGLAIFCDWYGQNAWISGDCGRWAEHQWIKDPPPQVDLLVVGHHGSRSASAPAFLRWVQAKQAWISCGRENRFHHPHEETIRQLSLRGVPISTTAEAGTLSLPLALPP